MCFTSGSRKMLQSTEEKIILQHETCVRYVIYINVSLRYDNCLMLLINRGFQLVSNGLTLYWGINFIFIEVLFVLQRVLAKIVPSQRIGADEVLFWSADFRILPGYYGVIFFRSSLCFSHLMEQGVHRSFLSFCFFYSTASNKFRQFLKKIWN